MKPATEALAKRISVAPLLDQFLLVGGTALSIYLEHRLSEDLDFATPNISLPKKEIFALLERFAAEGSTIEDIMPLAARHDAINDGYDIEDYQQDWLVDGVKLTFFTLEKENGREMLASDQGTAWHRKLRLASLDTLFITKSLVLADRHTIRDNFDMNVLLALGHYSYEDLILAYTTYRPGTSLEIPKKRLLSTDYPLTDPGFSGLVDASEVEIISKIHGYFTDLISNYESSVANLNQTIKS